MKYAAKATTSDGVVLLLKVCIDSSTRIAWLRDVEPYAHYKLAKFDSIAEAQFITDSVKLSISHGTSATIEIFVVSR